MRKGTKHIAIYLALMTNMSISLGINLIESISVHNNRIDVVPNKEFKEAFLNEDFFAEYDSDIALSELPKSILIMPFIMNVISIVWASNKTYTIDSMDHELYESLERVKTVFKTLYPSTTWDGKILPKKLTKKKIRNGLDPNKYVALLYSGGLDSTVSSMILKDKKQLLITAWGAWDIPLSDDFLWYERKAEFINYGKKYGHKNSFIKSNYSSFLNRPVLDTLSKEIHSWRMETVEGLGWAGLTAPILFSKGYKSLYIASSEAWAFGYPTAGNPYVDDNIRYSQISLHHHLFEYSRIDKIKWLSQARLRYGIDKLNIKACLDQTSKNCCNCARCWQTMGGLIILNEDINNYGFPLSRMEAIEALKNLHSRKRLSSDVLFNFQCMSNYLKKIAITGEPIPKDLLWLIDLRIDLENSDDIENQKKVDWKALETLFPKIPIQPMVSL